MDLEEPEGVILFLFSCFTGGEIVIVMMADSQLGPHPSSRRCLCVLAHCAACGYILIKTKYDVAVYSKPNSYSCICVFAAMPGW